MSFDFMKPDIWDGLVVGVTMVGIAMAILRLMNDRSHYQREQKRMDARNQQQLFDLDTEE